jgi:hypothetical protein
MDQYWIDIPLGDVRVSEIGDIIEKLRELGTAELNVNGKIPMAIRVVWTVGGEDVADLWELRGIIEDLNNELVGTYNIAEIGKPELVI